jgi:hypothetical protein
MPKHAVCGFDHLLSEYRQLASLLWDQHLLQERLLQYGQRDVFRF